MTTKAGVWIDAKQAILVLITDTGREIKKIKSKVGTPTRTGIGLRPKSKFTGHDLGTKDWLQRKPSQATDFYDEVIARLRGAEAILVFGPGGAKSDFVNRMNSKKLSGELEVQTAQKMSDREVAAKVSEHFATASAAKSASSKPPAKQTTESASGPATKRAAK